ncbi:M56 family metallopeptidase, partial [Streptomyces cacaoi]
MGVFVFLPLVLPLTALPIARVAAQHLHPRSATRLLTALGCVLALCSTLCLLLLMVVGTAQLPGNPLPDAWADPQVRAVVPYAEISGTAAIGALALVLGAGTVAIRRHLRVRARAHAALAGLTPRSADRDLAVLPDPAPYAYALPGTARAPGRVVVSTAMLDALDADERAALLAHERAHLAAGHHRHLLAVRLAACANPLLRPLREAVAYNAERWADEDAALAVADRR